MDMSLDLESTLLNEVATRYGRRAPPFALLILSG